MTDRARRVPVAAIAGGLFCLVLVFLALQVRAGKDPAIGAGTPVAAQPARKVIVKRVVVRRIVELPPKPAKRATVATPYPPAASAPARAVAPAAAAAPAPAAAPAAAPVPAPAPVVSRGS